MLAFAHHLKRLRDIVLDFKEHDETMKLLKKMLGSIGMPKSVQKLIAKNLEHLLYSGLVTLLSTKDSRIQLNTC